MCQYKTEEVDVCENERFFFADVKNTRQLWSLLLLMMMSVETCKPQQEKQTRE